MEDTNWNLSIRSALVFKHFIPIRLILPNLHYLTSSRRSVRGGVARKTASVNIGEKRGAGSPSPLLSLAVFRAAPSLTERVEEANTVITNKHFLPQALFDIACE